MIRIDFRVMDFIEFFENGFLENKKIEMQYE